MKLAYYPGCTARATAVEYGESVEEVCRYLGIELAEIADWNCCGASSAHVTNHELAIALPSRNIALAERMSLDMVTSCPACFQRHRIAQHELKESPQLKGRVETDIGTNLELSRETKHILQVLYHDVGLDAIREKVQQPLTGIKVVTYYGCFLVRPPEVTEFDNPENPVIMDRIMEALGVEVIDWAYKVDCCGGGLSITTPEIVKKLVGNITGAALESGAEAMVTACHLCQSNLDIYQSADENSPPIPVFYFSELAALALGSLKVRTWLGKHMVDATGLLKSLLLL